MSLPGGGRTGSGFGPAGLGGYVVQGAAVLGEQDQQRVLGMGNSQDIWNRTDPPPMLPVIIGEAALSRQVGGRQVMREQLEHLAALADHPRVSVQVLRFSSPGCTDLLAPFVVASFAPDPRPATDSFRLPSFSVGVPQAAKRGH